MSKICPISGMKVIYQFCMDCEEQICKKGKIKSMYKTIVIGIDPSYEDTGVTICADGIWKNLSHIDYPSGCNNSYKRRMISERLNNLIIKMKPKANKLIVVIERIRLQSQGFVNINYIKSIGALNATIIDISDLHNIPVYSVDTRCFKATVVGTSKEKQNKYGFDPKKWPTIQYIIKQGYEDYIKFPVSNRKRKGVIEKDGERFTYNDNIADSACIAMFYFVGDKNKLQIEH